MIYAIYDLEIAKAIPPKNEAETLKRLLQGTLIDPNTGNQLLYPVPAVPAIV
jgi:hypothetical protein